MNLYAYCANNPVYYVDPSGNACENQRKNLSNAINWTNHGYKHFPPKNQSWKNIVKSTKNGPAKYSLNIQDIEEFEREAWNTGILVRNGENWKTKEYDNIIGATEGKETKYVRIENSSNTINGHPIFEKEYLKLLKGDK